AEMIMPLVKHFAFWSWPRAILQFLSGAVLLWALIEVQPAGLNLAPALIVIVFVGILLEGMLSGGGLDAIFIQLPAAKKIGSAAYIAYLRATDASNGRIVYLMVGLLSNVATIGAFVLALTLPAPPLVSVLLAVASFGGVAAFLITWRAIPAMNQ